MSAERIDAAAVIARLEEAGTTLLSLPTTMSHQTLSEIVRTAVNDYGWSDRRLRPAIPSAAACNRMDEALSWIKLIPLDRYVLRRIVGARILVNQVTGRHLFPWRRLAATLGADNKAVQRWHRQGIDMIVAALKEKAL